MFILIFLLSHLSHSADAIPVTPERTRLLLEIEEGCVRTDRSGDSAAQLKKKCACVREEHNKTTPDAALAIISDHYNARRKFDTDDIADHESLALDIYFDIHSECKAKAGK